MKREMDPARLQVAADCLIDHGFDDVAEELRTHANSMKLAQEILDICRATIESDMDVIKNGISFVVTGWLPKQKLINAKRPSDVALDCAQELTKEFADGMIRRWLSDPLAITDFIDQITHLADA